jgi:hypothetical protein
VYEVPPEDRAAIYEFVLQYPKIGYRKLTWAPQAEKVSLLGAAFCQVDMKRDT